MTFLFDIYVPLHYILVNTNQQEETNRQFNPSLHRAQMMHKAHNQKREFVAKRRKDQVVATLEATFTDRIKTAITTAWAKIGSFFGRKRKHTVSSPRLSPRQLFFIGSDDKKHIVREGKIFPVRPKGHPHMVIATPDNRVLLSVR
jgi:hypothetical protein